MSLWPTKNICGNMDVITIKGIDISNEFCHISCKDNIIFHE